MNTFEYWEKRLKNEMLGEFSTDRVGLLWLKIKSIKRKEFFVDFAESSQISLTTTRLDAQFKELFNLLSANIEKSHCLLDEYIRNVNRSQIAVTDEQKLVSELYKLKTFDWGGDYQNSLDKYLVSRYVKVAEPSFDSLTAKFETEINSAVQGYVLNSWFNYWSSILIENIFKSHTAVLPTIGKIKNADFFINDIPFDLKVTYLPAEYIKKKRKEGGLPVELTFLKNRAKAAGISFDSKAKPNGIQYEIIEKMKDRNDAFCGKVLAQLQSETLTILDEARNNPKILAKWLYENQGEMRFGAENRLFLILVDTDNFAESWKLKRNIDLLRPSINNYLQNFGQKNLKDLELTFIFKDKPNPFNVLTDIVFVIR
ncbi:MAG: hypothetical protein LBT89_07510 [Planctomycetaceae bacterium]|jgi:hypothetical protein|nr:hypothetical protein [Planctomycetaceae bacterium]